MKRPRAADVNEIVRLMSKKRQRIEEREGIHIAHWEESIRADLTNVTKLIGQRGFDELRMRDVDATYWLCNRRNDIVFGGEGVLEAIESVRSRNRIVFPNPYTMSDRSTKSSPVIQSWAKPYSITREYKKHLPAFRYKGASKYLPKMDFVALELMAFRRGLGILKGPKRMFLYAKFNQPIGTLPDGKHTAILAVQCDRVGRSASGRKSGFATKLHGYPISENELRADLNGSHEFVGHVCESENTFELSSNGVPGRG